jgi:hypothetical protein
MRLGWTRWLAATGGGSADEAISERKKGRGRLIAQVRACVPPRDALLLYLTRVSDVARACVCVV